jgi:hypothetical protein
MNHDEREGPKIQAELGRDNYFSCKYEYYLF